MIGYSDLFLLNNDVLENVEKIARSGISSMEIMLAGRCWDDLEGQIECLAPALNLVQGKSVCAQRVRIIRGQSKRIVPSRAAVCGQCSSRICFQINQVIS